MLQQSVKLFNEIMMLVVDEKMPTVYYNLAEENQITYARDNNYNWSIEYDGSQYTIMVYSDLWDKFFTGTSSVSLLDALNDADKNRLEFEHYF